MVQGMAQGVMSDGKRRNDLYIFEGGHAFNTRGQDPVRKND
jgi:hypothetical protein